MDLKGHIKTYKHFYLEILFAPITKSMFYCYSESTPELPKTAMVTAPCRWAQKKLVGVKFSLFPRVCHRAQQPPTQQQQQALPQESIYKGGHQQPRHFLLRSTPIYKSIYRVTIGWLVPINKGERGFHNQKSTKTQGWIFACHVVGRRFFFLSLVKSFAIFFRQVAEMRNGCATTFFCW